MPVAPHPLDRIRVARPCRSELAESGQSIGTGLFAGRALTGLLAGRGGRWAPGLRRPAGWAVEPTGPAGVQAPMRHRDAALAAVLLAAAFLLFLPPVARAGGADRASLVTAARSYLDRPYAWGGRGAALDCLGLVFRAWQDVTGTSWKAISVYPTTMVRKEQVGAPVPGLDGVRTAKVPWDRLEPGDIILFLNGTENPAEPALATVDGTPMWVWHTAIFSGGPAHNFVVADHFAGAVVETALPRYLAEEGSGYDGIFIVRAALPAGAVDSLHPPG